MSTAIAAAGKSKSAIARPLHVVVPLIQRELEAGAEAGLEHYRRAGALLLETRTQVAPFKWGRWLDKNFALSRRTALEYMTLAERVEADPDLLRGAGQSIRSITRPDAPPAFAKYRNVIDATKKINVDRFAQARQAIEAERKLARALAAKLIDLGYKALATRLHPDRGGSEDAMRRLNRVHADLKSVALHRRF